MCGYAAARCASSTDALTPPAAPLPIHQSSLRLRHHHNDFIHPSSCDDASTARIIMLRYGVTATNVSARRIALCAQSNMQYPVGKPGCWNPHNPNCTSPANDPQCVCSPKGEYPGGGGACEKTVDFCRLLIIKRSFAKTGLGHKESSTKQTVLDRLSTRLWLHQPDWS